VRAVKDVETTEQQQVGPEARPESTTPAEQQRSTVSPQPGHSITLRDLKVFYGNFMAVKGVDIDFAPNRITAIIGPSGCGKSTLVRSINRMHEEIPGGRIEGEILLDDTPVYGDDVDVVAVRRAIGMVFQRPNPFPTMSIFDNVAAGLRLTGTARGKNLSNIVHEALRSAGLWTEVKGRLDKPANGLSGGQQQRLCIARALAVQPEVLLMDEPCSALDPVATLKIEELLKDLKKRITIVLVTHNMQQAARVSDVTAFMLDGDLVEVDETEKIFTNPSDERTEQVRGREVRLMATEGRLHLRDDIRELEKRALSAMDIVADQIDRSMRVVVDRDFAMADMVIADDDRIDGRFLEVHGDILSLIARQAPVATDLRLLAALLDVIRRIERMGDQCVNICKVLLLAPPAPTDDLGMTERILDMGRRARALAVDSSKTFLARDVPGAERLAEVDDEIDDLNRQVFQIAVALAGDPEAREWAMRMTQVARAIERIGDNAVDIGEETAFVASGVYREFEDASHANE